ncbi:hypothetical protein N7508_000585 [Penicillium antarcticum]|uniref:uncharacterized protein n=1 Tax=Penicillium antarcticum TaxID=416450 RepID=UPI0023A04FA7|nr:uncharacterized protein N7508_000585 [Penicillium antarcticum]KAJ5320302.1 hypothetical protein N7508_000585 [Penicillium antarcticum]
MTMTATKAIVAREPTEPHQVNWSLEDVDVGMPGEGAGIVRCVGPNTSSVMVGDPVLLSYHSCGSCKQCLDSHPAYCDTFAPENYIGHKGSMSIQDTGDMIASRFFGQSSLARYSVVSERSIVNVKGILRDQEELKLFAPLGCGFQTGMGAICNTSNAGPKDTVMILGLGAVGMGALMTAKIYNCAAIIVVDRIESRLQLAKTLGASHTINTSASDYNTLKESASDLVPSGVSVVIDTTGVPSLIEDSLRCTRKLGKLVLIGVPPMGYGLNIDVAEHINSIPQMIKWYREGRFPIERLVQYFKVRDSILPDFEYEVKKPPQCEVHILIMYTLQAPEFQDALSQLKEGTVIKPVLSWD